MELNEIVKGIVNDKISDIHTCLPAKIEDYDHETMYAKVVLLAKKEFEGEMEELTPIIDVPVSHIKAGNFIVRPPYKKDDVVLVAFSEAGLDKLLITGEPEDPQFSRRFAYDDAIVIQGLKTEQDDDYKSDYDDGLYIANIEEDVEIIFEGDGNIRIIDNANGTELKFDVESVGDVIFDLANQLFLGSASANEGVPLGDSLKEWLDTHSHPATGSPPSSESPDPSEKVMVE